MLRTLLGLIMSRATWVAQRITTSNKLVIFLMVPCPTNVGGVSFQIGLATLILAAPILAMASCSMSNGGAVSRKSRRQDSVSLSITALKLTLKQLANVVNVKRSYTFVRCSAISISLSTALPMCMRTISRALPCLKTKKPCFANTLVTSTFVAIWCAKKLAPLDPKEGWCRP